MSTLLRSASLSEQLDADYRSTAAVADNLAEELHGQLDQLATGAQVSLSFRCSGG